MEFVVKHRVVHKSGATEVYWTGAEEAKMYDLLKKFPESIEIHTADPYYCDLTMSWTGRRQQMRWE